MTVWSLISLAGQFLVIFFLFYIGVIIHETGHLIAALMIGWKPITMTIGKGKKRTLFRIRDLSFVFGEIPSGGLMQSAALRIDYWKPKRFLHALGGPVATCCVVIASFFIVSGNIISVSGWWLTPLEIYCFAELSMLVACLWPYTMFYDGRAVSSDGLSMWNALTLKRGEVPLHFAANAQFLGTFLIKEGRLAEAKETITKGLSLTAGALSTETYWIHCLMQAGKRELAKVECQRLLEENNGLTDSRADILDNLACIPIYYNHPEMLDDASHYIDMALAEAPDLITLKGTKASILIEQGFVAEGMKLLEEVIEKSDSKNDQAICKYYMALGWYKNGEVNKAYEYLRAAQAFDPKCIVHTQIENQIVGRKNTRS